MMRGVSNTTGSRRGPNWTSENKTQLHTEPDTLRETAAKGLTLETDECSD